MNGVNARRNVHPGAIATKTPVDQLTGLLQTPVTLPQIKLSYHTEKNRFIYCRVSNILLRLRLKYDNE